MCGQLNVLLEKICLQKVWAKMQLLMITQSSLCLFSNVEKKISLHFECYDFTNEIISVPKI